MAHEMRKILFYVQIGTFGSFVGENEVEIVCKKRLKFTKPPRTRNASFFEINGWASAAVSILAKISPRRV